MEETKPAEMWAIVELMGHQRMAGLVTETTVAGAGFLRIDVPKTEAGPGFTRMVSPSAIYAINPTTEELVRRAAAASSFCPKPVQPWELPGLPPAPPPPPPFRGGVDNEGDLDEDDRG